MSIRVYSAKYMTEPSPTPRLIPCQFAEGGVGPDSAPAKTVRGGA